jgi:hypothetical protein
MDSRLKDLKKRIDQKQKELKRYSDDEIRQMHLDVYDLDKADSEEIDPILAAALANEVQRRWQAVSWIWKRKSHTEDNKKWVEHNRESEIKATKYAIKKLSKHDDSESKETIKKLKTYLEQLTSN